MHIDLLKAQDPRNYIGSAWTHSTWFSLSLSLSGYMMIEQPTRTEWFEKEKKGENVEFIALHT